jgi:hypothetical protein
MTVPLAQEFAQVEAGLVDCPSRKIHAARYHCPACEAVDATRAALSKIERHVQEMEPTYPATPVDCLISELRDSFFQVLSRTSVMTLARFEERIAQFNAEVAALPAQEGAET